MKRRIAPALALCTGRAPRGARGLKLALGRGEVLAPASRPARGAWIETTLQSLHHLMLTVAPRAGRVD